MATSNVNQPVFNPADFVPGQPIDNKYLPWKPGTTFVYDTYLPGNVLEQIDTVTVTTTTKKIDGVICTAVSDNVTDPKTGAFIEKTTDYYAQDKSGNVWYFGEASVASVNGKLIDKSGSWLAGIQGALPGIIQEANPQVGDSYDEENAPNVAHDHGQVISLKGSASVPFGTFKHDLLVTHETSLLEPGAAENKYYAAGIGEVFGVDLVSGEEDRLVSVTPAPGTAAATNVSQLVQSMAGFGASGGGLDSGLMPVAANESGLSHILAVHAHHG